MSGVWSHTRHDFQLHEACCVWTENSFPGVLYGRLTVDAIMNPLACIVCAGSVRKWHFNGGMFSWKLELCVNLETTSKSDFSVLYPFIEARELVQSSYW